MLEVGHIKVRAGAYMKMRTYRSMVIYTTSFRVLLSSCKSGATNHPSGCSCFTLPLREATIPSLRCHPADAWSWRIFWQRVDGRNPLPESTYDGYTYVNQWGFSTWCHHTNSCSVNDWSVWTLGFLVWLTWPGCVTKATSLGSNPWLSWCIVVSCKSSISTGFNLHIYNWVVKSPTCINPKQPGYFSLLTWEKHPIPPPKKCSHKNVGTMKSVTFCFIHCKVERLWKRSPNKNMWDLKMQMRTSFQS